MDAHELRQTASLVLSKAAHHLSPFWQIVFRGVAAGGPPTKEQAEVVMKTAQQLKLSLPPSSAKQSVRSPSFFGALMDSIDAELPDHGKQREALTKAMAEYPDDMQRAHLAYVLMRGPRT